MAPGVPGRRRGGAAVAAAFWAARRPGRRGSGLRPSDLGPTGGDGLDPAPPQGRDRAAGGADDLGFAAERPVAAKGGFAWRRPRHSLKGRQDAQAVERSGLRLKLLRQQARAGDIRLLFADESEALTHPYLAQMWARRGADLRIEAPGRACRRALLGALDAATGRLIVATSPSKRSADFIGLLARLDRELAPPPGALAKPTVLVLDNGPIHTSRATAKALAARPWLTIEWLPRYAPELNDIERSWRDLKRHHLAHQTFTSADHLDTQIHRAVAAMNQERRPDTCPNLRMAA
jgi:transposase